VLSYFGLHFPEDYSTVMLQYGGRYTHTDIMPQESFIFTILSWQRPGFNPRIVHGRLSGNGTSI